MSIIYSRKDDPLVLVAKLRVLAEDIERMTVFVPRAELADVPLIEGWRHCLFSVPSINGMVLDDPAGSAREVITTEVYAFDKAGRWARTFDGFYRLGVYAPARRHANDRL